MLKVMTLNLANYDDHHNWETRLPLIVNSIINSDAQIVCLQEVRFNPAMASTAETYQNMAEQILCSLNQHDKYVGSALVTQPTMYYPSMLPESPAPKYYPLKPAGDSQPGNEWEGKSIISSSRFPVLETGTRFLAMPAADKDPNRRSAQYVLVEPSKGVELYVCNCHFSYDSTNFESNVLETMRYLHPMRDRHCLLVGDFNMPPDARGFHHLLENGYHDVWNLLCPSKAGYTDRTNPQRIDYVWASSHLSPRLKTIKRVATTTDKDCVYASDHFGLVAEIDI